jgi:hypothetical protein
MAAPVVVVCAKNTWEKVATGVTSAVLHRISIAPHLYKMTYVDTEDPSPTDDSLAALMFSDSPNEEEFNSSDLSDIYVKAVGAAGLVRVDS